MKVIALNSSPRTGSQSKTELLLNKLLSGMRDAGAEVVSYNLAEKKIKNCIGCFTCWTKTPGNCVLKDDMTNEIFLKWLEADLVVYGTPLYNHTLNSIMSTMIERLLPAVQPFFEEDENGNTFHPLRSRFPSAVWLSVCGFPEESEFNTLKEYLKRIERKDAPIVAEIFRTSSESLLSPIYADKINNILDAVYNAGTELVTRGNIKKETLSVIKQPLNQLQNHAELGNIFWKTCIKEGVTVKEFQDKGLVPRAETIDEFMVLFTYGLNSKAAGEGKITLQFNFSGHVNESCYFDIDKDNIEALKGSAKSPDVEIDTPFDLWMDIITKKADGQQMFMEQKYKVSGDLPLMVDLFKKEG